ncbi:UDP-N-acetylmuramoyl-L-alanine--D-glutamate ligase [Yonghaparkia sp. Root332]|uniref:UDP-N-acetylmuramoyl-L-alanine--D-glutamate ligase n=1 Tax=Yonghaparkia sp. Root332 TaxID=1736516 RepID=UPI0006FF67A5|nr:UDP-N-acetylmuramoyl-L-alanine--D-glutamate ligase [Yonghaparkia sp. Root332]KQV25144.1 UDP-N-acetylmuramoylalanine--D-glutamate ligase [Yonghaparkia sp. Root332]
MGEPVTVNRLDDLTSWHADWSGLRVLVLGLGVTGFAAADTLAELGAQVAVAARNPDDDRARILPVIGVELIELEGSDEDALPRLAALEPELLIVSPGFRPDHAILRWAEAHGIPMWGDIELAWRVRDKIAPAAQWVLITGTNGKTTTTQLTATMLREAGIRAAPCGNIGIPVLDAVRDPAGFDVLVVELSSFQLHQLPTEGPGALGPIASACLNLAEDHYDWHGSAEAYRDAKAKVYANTLLACVYNRADAATMRMVEEADVVDGARAIGFGTDTPGPSDVGVVDDILVDRAFLDDRHRSALELGTLADVRIAGLATPHGLANALAAAALARAAGAPPLAVRDGLRAFRVDHHRTEIVRDEGGVMWVDDSKATNPHAANSALSAFRSVVWIVGGLLKGVEIDALVETHRERLRAAIVVGVDRAAVLAAFGRHAPELPVFEVEADDTEQVMPVAVRLAAAAAHDGDTVLLAPAAASMDQFADYADRGRRFQAAVREHHDPS